MGLDLFFGTMVKYHGHNFRKIAVVVKGSILISQTHLVFVFDGVESVMRKGIMLVTSF